METGHSNLMTRRDFIKTAAVPARGSAVGRSDERRRSGIQNAGDDTVVYRGVWACAGARSWAGSAAADEHHDVPRALPCAGRWRYSIGARWGDAEAEGQGRGIWDVDSGDGPDTAERRYDGAGARFRQRPRLWERLRSGMLSGRRYETFATARGVERVWVKQSHDALKVVVPLAERWPRL